MPTSPSSWRTCDAAAYERLRSDIREAIRLALPESVAGHREGDLAELLEPLWTIDGYSRSEIDKLAALPASEAGGADDD